MNDDKKKQLIAWLESMPWWGELPYATLEAVNAALLEMLYDVADLAGPDDWGVPERKDIDEALAKLHNTQEVDDEIE